MMEILLLAAVSFSASLLSFYSGFGLGTILMPVMAIFMPLSTAIALTALVHWIHNLLKGALLRKFIDWRVALKFGATALVAAIPGAVLLKKLTTLPPFFEYRFWSVHGSLSWLHLSIGLLLCLVATLSLFPQRLGKIRNWILGGVLSGFFGGLSGFQGAFRGLFMVQTDLDKKGFIATNAAIGLALDSARLAV